MHRLLVTALATLAAASLATPAFAQKSKDTLRLAINAPFVVLSQFHLPVDEAANFSRAVYDTLIAYDERGKKWLPVLAKSWTRKNPTTLEFELRDDITFHNGNKFDADDVVAIVDYLRDPKVPITFKARYTWVDKIEKLGPYKVRLTATEPNSLDLGLLAYRFHIWDAETLAQHPQKEDYGRLTPVGTNVFKVVQLDKNKGIIVEAVKNHYGDKKYQRTGVGRIHGVPLPDRQTQIAQLMTGGIDMIRDATPDDAKELGKNPKFEVTNTPAQNIFYIGLDTTGTSGNKVFTDVRVRKALWMSIDRASIIEHIVPGGPKVVQKLDALCFPTSTPGCEFSVKPPKFDPDGAKKLLAEAGYPNGFDYEWDVYAPNKTIAEAVAGSLLKAGIRAAVQPVTVGTYRKKQGEGKLQSWSILFPTGSHPDVHNNLATLLVGPPQKYFDDPELYGLLSSALKEFDDAKRTAIYGKIHDIVNSRHYLLPVTSVPNAYVHTKEVRVLDNPIYAGDTTIADYAWK